jgi:hypothetical protein
MPGSARENDKDLRNFIWHHPEILRVLDVGPGRGTYAKVLKGLGLTIDAVEIWTPYISRYGLEAKYNRVISEDIRLWQDFDYDLVIFGDVLEHMSADDSLLVWKKASLQATYGMISVPIIHYPQGESHGNPHEVHIQDHLTPDQIRTDYGPFEVDLCYKVTGTFIRRF